MIKLFTKPEMPEIKNVNPFIKTKIEAELSAYGTNFSFLDFWYQQNCFETTSIICKKEETFFITARTNADFCELKEFVKMLGYKQIQTDFSTAKGLNLPIQKQYDLLLYNGLTHTSDLCNYTDLHTAYNILFNTQNKDIEKSEFNGWYADISHKIRHGQAAIALMGEKSVAVSSHISEDGAIISGVATLPSERHKGYGAKAVNQLISHLKGKKIYTASFEATDFYLKLGFVKIDKILII